MAPPKDLHRLTLEIDRTMTRIETELRRQNAMVERLGEQLKDSMEGELDATAVAGRLVDLRESGRVAINDLITVIMNDLGAPSVAMPEVAQARAWLKEASR